MSTNITEKRTGRHCIFEMHCHLVFVTKYRKNVFTKHVLNEMKNIFEKICNDFEVELKEFNGEANHVHLLVNYPPKVAIAKLVNSLKGVSSRRLKQTFPELNSYYISNALWSPSYYAGSCGGASIDTLKHYIENQNSPT